MNLNIMINAIPRVINMTNIGSDDSFFSSFFSYFFSLILFISFPVPADSAILHLDLSVVGNRVMILITRLFFGISAFLDRIKKAATRNFTFE